MCDIGGNINIKHRKSATGAEETADRGADG